MPTTTNYGWTTPADTDLVKDGAAAIRTLGSSIDTSVKSLNAGTTAGDIDYYTSSTAKARVGIGTTGQILTVAGGVPTWAAAGGALTLSQIASGNINSGTSVTISSLTQDFIQVYVKGVTCATSFGQLQLRINGSSSAVYEYNAGSFSNAPAANVASTYSTPSTEFSTNGGFNQLFSNSTNFYLITLTNCKSTGFTTVSWNSVYQDTGSNNRYVNGSGIFKSAIQVTSLVLANTAGNAFNGSGTYTVVGA